MANSLFNNRLLDALPKRDRDLVSALKPVDIKLRQILYEVGAPLKYVYFLQSGVGSVMMNMANGDAIEVGMVGNEGIVGGGALLGAKTSSQHVVVQVDGTALRMNADQCKAIFDKNAAFRKIALRYLEAFYNLTAQTAACNQLHPIEQRCARWLLMATDRTHTSTIPMTHEFLAAMLGVRRAGVSETAGAFQRAGLIKYRRGELRINDQKGLEAVACECHSIDRDRFGWLGGGL